MQQIAATYGAAGGRRGWIVWFTVNYPDVAASAPALASRQIPARRPDGWCPPPWVPASPDTFAPGQDGPGPVVTRGPEPPAIAASHPARSLDQKTCSQSERKAP